MRFMFCVVVKCFSNVSIALLIMNWLKVIVVIISIFF